MHVGLDNVCHDEGGLVDAVPLPRDGDDDLLGAHLRLLDHDPGAGVVRDAADDLARHPGHVLQHAAGDLDVLGGDVGAALHEDLVVVLLSRHLGQGWHTVTFSGPGIKFMFTNTT